MADPHDKGDGRDSKLVKPGLTGGDERDVGNGDTSTTVKDVSCRVEMLPPSDLAAERVEESPETKEEERRLVEADHRADRDESEEPGRVTSFGNFSDHGMHAFCDLEESRALQIEDGQLSTSVELTRAITTMVGSGSIDRHVVTWEKIDLILASILGARSTTSIITPAKLKVRDLRRIHIQDTLNTSPSSLPKSSKQSRPRISPKATQHFLTLTKLPYMLPGPLGQINPYNPPKHPLKHPLLKRLPLPARNPPRNGWL